MMGDETHQFYSMQRTATLFEACALVRNILRSKYQYQYQYNSVQLTARH